MGKIHVEAERVVDAQAKKVYSILSDYRNGHPRVLPPEYFKDFTVEKGGQGAGTIVRFVLQAGGRKRPYRMRVSEPKKGRVLQEADLGSSLVTTFFVEPEDGGQRARVRIATDWEGAKGIGGFFERTFAPGAMRKIYGQELQRLAEVVVQ